MESQFNHYICKNEKGLLIREYYNPSTFPVLPGSEDSNNKRLYEGSVIKDKLRDRLGTVSYDTETACFYIKWQDGESQTLGKTLRYRDLTVVGHVVMNDIKG